METARSGSRSTPPPQPTLAEQPRPNGSQSPCPTDAEGRERNSVVDRKLSTTASEIRDFAGSAICFGSFRLLPAQRLLLEGNKPLRIGSRALDILIALVE